MGVWGNGVPPPISVDTFISTSDDADLENAVRTISTEFVDVPCGFVLWHATKPDAQLTWAYKQSLWLASSATAEGSWAAVKKGRACFMKLYVCDNVRGIPCSGEYSHEFEIILEDGMRLERISEGDTVCIEGNHFPCVRWKARGRCV